MPNTFISPKTHSSYRYVCLFIAFQATHPSSMANPCQSITFIFGLAGPILGLILLWPLTSMTTSNLTNNLPLCHWWQYFPSLTSMENGMILLTIFFIKFSSYHYASSCWCHHVSLHVINMILLTHALLVVALVSLIFFFSSWHCVAHVATPIIMLSFFVIMLLHLTLSRETPPDKYAALCHILCIFPFHTTLK